MLPIRAMRTSSGLRSAARNSTSTRISARSFATVAEEVDAPSSSLYDRKVDMSNVEKGKNFFINYKRIEDNLKIVRGR